jgi:hypothetical protein
LGHAWYRRIQSLGIAQKLNDANDNLENWLVHLFGLPFIYPTEVGDCFMYSLRSVKPDNINII